MGNLKINSPGSIYKEGESKWTAKIPLGRGTDGKLKYKKFSAKSKVEVKKKAEEFIKLQKINSSALADANLIIFQDFAQNWIDKYLSNTLKPSSLSRKQQTFDYQVKPYLGMIPMYLLSSEQIQEMISQLRNQGLSYSTIKKSYEFVNGCMRRYRLQYKANNNPCEGVVLPKNLKKGSHETVNFYTKEQSSLIIHEATKKFNNGQYIYRLGQAIVVLLYTGLRIGELLSLTWEDCDFNKNTISITKDFCEIIEDNKIKAFDQTSPKSKSSNRIIPMNNKAKQALIELRKITGQYEHIMSTKNGGRIYHRNVDRMFRCICSKANVPLNGVHALRHTFASMLFRNGCEVKYISDILGHSDVSITINIYITLMNEQKVKAMKSLESYID